MGRPSPRRRPLVSELARRHPHLENPDVLIASGRVLVNGMPRTNPASLVEPSDSIKLPASKPLRGTAKLEHALRVFDVDPRGRVALDLGAAAGGFTQALLAAGAARVYAVDAGHGQLRGWLRQDPRVVNLERTNLGELDVDRVPEPVELISFDLSYLSIASAVAQLHALTIEPRGDVIALVKPAYELGLPEPPFDQARLTAAVRHAADGLAASGWRVVASDRSPVRGARGAIEYLVHACRVSGRGTPAARRRSAGSRARARRHPRSRVRAQRRPPPRE
jgi:23S rRNA (cytidine1920-2'-O)/16S rRNA (cytidine1409-2'-O)-methyltransferase